MSMSTPCLLWLLVVAAALQCSRCQGRDALVRKIQDQQAAVDSLGVDPDVLERARSELHRLWTDYYPLLADDLELSDTSNDSLVSEACANSTLAIIGSMLQENTTGIPEIAILLDATGKQGAGLLQGNIILDGAFDECFEYDFTGYCLGNVELSFLPPGSQIVWRVGLCVPKHCTPTDVALVMNFTGLFRVDEGLMSCSDQKRPSYSAGTVVMLVVSGLFVLLVVLGTAADVMPEMCSAVPYRRNLVEINANGHTDERSPILTGRSAVVASGGKACFRGVKPMDFLTAFSLYKTVPTLLATKQAPGVITSLNGLRVMSMFWVILGHVTQFSLLVIDNPLQLESRVSQFSFQPVVNGYFSVDSFFFLSAVLVAYLTFRQMKKKGRFPFLHYYLHRYLRLTPVYAFVLFFTWALYNHVASGATFLFPERVIDIFDQCKKYWWTNLLYINNFYPWKLGEECFQWTWYLANDMQFYVIAPLILLPLYYLVPVGVIVAGAFLLSSFVVTGTLIGYYDFQANPFSIVVYQKTPKTNLSSDDLIYIKPWGRIAPYIVGLLFGAILAKGVRLKLGRIMNATFYLSMWMVSGFLLSVTVYGLYFQLNGDHMPTTAENVVYLTFGKLAWGVGLALLVFCCHSGYGGVINTFLSYNVWTPLSRMTFNAYLVHPVVLFVLYGQLQKTFHFTDINVAIFVIVLCVISYAMAAVLCVCVELPLGTIEMLLFKMVGLGGRESQRNVTSAAPTESKKVEGEEEEKKVFVQGSV